MSDAGLGFVLGLVCFSSINIIKVLAQIISFNVTSYAAGLGLLHLLICPSALVSSRVKCLFPRVRWPGKGQLHSWPSSCVPCPGPYVPLHASPVLCEKGATLLSLLHLFT
jgi:hypothetical protein